MSQDHPDEDVIRKTLPTVPVKHPEPREKPPEAGQEEAKKIEPKPAWPYPTRQSE